MTSPINPSQPGSQSWESPIQERTQNTPPDLIVGIKEALRKGNLREHLETIDLEQLWPDLLKNSENAPLFEMLEVCEAPVALRVICCLTQCDLLATDKGYLHAIEGLKILNRPDRLAVFIDALKLGRGPLFNSINTTQLSMRDTDPQGQFKGLIPHYIREAIKIEHRHQPECFGSAIKRHFNSFKEVWLEAYSIERQSIELDRTLEEAQKEGRLEAFDRYFETTFEEAKKEWLDKMYYVSTNLAPYANQMLRKLLKECRQAAPPNREEERLEAVDPHQERIFQEAKEKWWDKMDPVSPYLPDYANQMFSQLLIECRQAATPGKNEQKV